MDLRLLLLLCTALCGLVALPSFAGLIRVPQDVASLQDAIDQAQDTDVIEIAAGTYPSPAGGFQINNKQTTFTIRAATGATVVLDGGNAREVLRFQNTDPQLGGHVTFAGLIFRNGFSNTLGLTAGVTMQRATGTFTDCRFEDNDTIEPATIGAGVQVAIGSNANFTRCVWQGNTALFFGGAMGLEEASTAVIEDSQFIGNLANLPNHNVTSSGGAIHVGNSTLTVDRTRFEGNESGFAGGAIFAIGLWDDPNGSNLTVRNSTFVDNKAERHPTVSSPFPTEGGAIHTEDLVITRISDSLFAGNEAHDGAGVNLYRAETEVQASVFRGNHALGGEAAGSKSLGGQISAISNDVSDASTNFGAINRRPAQLTITDSYFQGRFGAVGVSGDVGGCIFAAGDTNRAFGLGGVAQEGTLADNRAVVSITDSILYDCDVQEHTIGGSGVGGGMAVDLVDLTLLDTGILGCDAIGLGNGSGGGLALLSHSHVELQRVTLAGNSAGRFGGGLFAQGVDLEVSDSIWIANEVSPGVSEECFPSNGAGVFSAPFLASGGRTQQDATGFIQNSLFSGNVGLPIFEDDRTNGPINDMQYDGNDFYSDFFSGAVYTSSVNPPPAICVTAAVLNDHVVTRNGGPATTKSLVDNTDLVQEPLEAVLQRAPPYVRAVNAEGDPAPPEPAFLGMVWSGGAATLNGNPLGGNAAMAEAPAGSYTLLVAGSLEQTVVLPEPGSLLLQLLAVGSVFGLRLRRPERSPQRPVRRRRMAG